jgi:LCP family protein required for cell wall assembly
MPRLRATACQRAQRQTRRTRMASLVAFGFLMSGTGGAAAYFLPLFAILAGQTGQSSHAPAAGEQGLHPVPEPAANTFGGPAFTMLLLGSDNDAKFQGSRPLTQSMILVRVDPPQRKVVMLSIPRDLWVPLSTGGQGRIDSAYELGGAEGAVQTVEQDLNIAVDCWAWVGLQGLVKLIDQMGGVDFALTNPVLDDFYPNDLNAANPYSLHRLAIAPGYQHLDGAHALEYVRSRHSDFREDFGRSVRQQQVLVALRAKARGINASDLPAMAASFQGEFATSLDLRDLDRIRGLLSLATQVQNNSITQLVMMDGYTSDSVVDDQDVLLPNWGMIRGLAHTYFPAA